MSAYVYLHSERAGVHGAENDLFTVGFYDPSGRWVPESDYGTRHEAAARVSYLNGDAAVRGALDEALNSGDGSYRP